MAKTTNTRIPSNINLGDVMRDAWKGYRKQVGDNDFPFSRKLFGAHLRSAWSVARIMNVRHQQETEQAAKLASDNLAVRRAAEIRAELQNMEYGDRIDWPRHRALSAELFSLAA